MDALNTSSPLKSDAGTRKNLKWVRATVYVLSAILAMAVFWYGLTFLLGTSTPAFVVSSGSMVPTLKIGDVILVRDNGGFDTIAKGDIIVFNSPVSPDKVIVHRVYSFVNDRGSKGVITRGDNNPSPDSWILREENYIGKVVFTLPQIGRLKSLISPPLNYILIAVVLALIFVTELKGGREKESKEAETLQNAYGHS